MSLVTSKEVARAINVDKLGPLGNFIGWSILKMLRLSRCNDIYDRNKHLEGLEFLNALLEDFEIKFEIPEDDLRRIPKDGAFITISNHPLGGIDGILLLRLLVERRVDYKIIANFLLHRIEPLKPYIMPVNPFEDRKDLRSSVTGIKNALKHLKEGNPLGIFPAGEVSTTKEGKAIVDKPWEEGAIKIIQKAKVPVIPIYFHAKNSDLFYALAKLNPSLRTAKLPSELLSQKGRVIKVRIGKPIQVSEQDQYKDLCEFGDFIRKKTYMLAKPFEEDSKRIFKNVLKFPKPIKEIVSQGDPEKVKEEVNALREKGLRLFTSKNYEVYFSKSAHMPYTMYEIGRLREITFREVGEGTQEETDIDVFDSYYHHLFLWDTSTNQIVGAYRMGLGKSIYKEYGIKGFYIHTLFKFEPELYKMMENSIEMGRAFIVGEYQRKPMPLFLLWKGIIHVTLHYPEYKYLIGGVSISNQFSNFSKSLMIEFMKSHYYDPYVAQYIHPKQEYKVVLEDADKDFIFDAAKADLNKFDRFIDELEPGALRIPVLIKKYLKQNARLVAFNVDPKFNNAVDGLLYIRVSDIPESTVKPVMEEYQKALENGEVFSATESAKDEPKIETE